MRPYIILVSIIAFWFGCDSKQIKIENSAETTFSDTLTVDFGDLPLPNEYSSSGNYQDKFYYTYFFRDSMGLFFYNHDSRIWTSNYIPIEGPEGLVKEGEFVVLNDSLAFHPLLGLAAFQLVNYQNGQVSRFKFPDSRSGFGKISDKSVHFDGVSIRFPLSYSKTNKNPDYVSEVPIYGVFDLDSSNFTYLMNFPEELYGETYSSNFLSKTFLVVEDEIYLNLSKSHNIYKYDLDLSLKEIIPLQSQNVDTSNPGLEDDQILNMMNFELGGKYSLLLESDGNLYRTVSYFSESNSNSVKNLNEYYQAFENLRFEILKYSPLTKKTMRYNFSGSPASQGIGDGLYLDKGEKLYFWLFDKEEEELEKFVSISEETSD